MSTTQQAAPTSAHHVAIPTVTTTEPSDSERTAASEAQSAATHHDSAAGTERTSALHGYGSTSKMVTLPSDSTPTDRSDTNDDTTPPSDQPFSRRSTRASAGATAAAGEGAFEKLPLKKRLTDLLIAERKISREPTLKESLWAIITATWLNVLLVFIPVGWALHFAKVNDTIIFIFTFLSIIPLAKMLGTGTEELALRVGQTLGGLLNATLGNAVELIIAIIALVKCEIRVVQSSLLGSILSNLLLVMGMCFFLGGLRYSEQAFGGAAAQLNSSLLVISVIAILVPAGYSAAFRDTNSDSFEKSSILSMSRGTSILLLLTYGAYLSFQLFTHPHLYVEAAQQDNGEDFTKKLKLGRKEKTAFKPAKSVRKPRQALVDPEEGAVQDDDDEEVPTLTLWAAVGLLVVATVLIAITAEFLVSSINGLTEQHPEISVEWVGLILLPIVGNAAEHLTAVASGLHDKLDLALGVAVGSSIQIALFVIPFMVTLGWILNKPLSLLFDPFESIVLFLSVLIANYTLQDGRSNWMEGWLLMMVYVIIAVSLQFFRYPSSSFLPTPFLIWAVIIPHSSSTSITRWSTLYHYIVNAIAFGLAFFILGGVLYFIRHGLQCFADESAHNRACTCRAGVLC
ncbi:BZ3500_MvSof-1268-A1-R1_Chr2-2g05188 [Microbotryum saponariae]|uniref:Vacuolar calcium ion transporter n=1 Tax=Microbotryum saponariae TaxID=289078 RepID=A0A2X0K4T1_9BASI|nr:BZ3500_MvSof-1268-A1-R1_Chr2-2g05188 [Microbotryum saponariae]SDA01015.1 BZ3501_MvSof-1269-A2-R1_Chr2-2g04862 [Microbotryum saponariae]